MCAGAEAHGQSGFSLVEVLCALAIAAASIVVLSGGATGSLRGARALDMHLGARLVLQSILEDELSAIATVPATRQGDSGAYRWQLKIEPAEALAPGKLPAGVRMYRLTASVAWGRGGEDTASVLKLAR